MEQEKGKEKGGGPFAAWGMAADHRGATGVRTWRGGLLPRARDTRVESFRTGARRLTRRRQATRQRGFVELRPPRRASGVCVESGRWLVRVEPGFDAATLLQRWRRWPRHDRGRERGAHLPAAAPTDMRKSFDGLSGIVRGGWGATRCPGTCSCS